MVTLPLRLLHTPSGRTRLGQGTKEDVFQVPQAHLDFNPQRLSYLFVCFVFGDRVPFNPGWP